MKSFNLKIRYTIYPKPKTGKLFRVILEFFLFFVFIFPLDVFHEVIKFGNPSY